MNIQLDPTSKIAETLNTTDVKFSTELFKFQDLTLYKSTKNIFVVRNGKILDYDVASMAVATAFEIDCELKVVDGREYAIFTANIRGKFTTKGITVRSQVSGLSQV